MKISEQLVRSVLPSDLGTKIPWRPWLQLAYFLLLISFVLGDCTDFQSVDQWLNHGGNLQNQRFAQYENKINVKSVSRLRIKWTSFIGASVSATASISDGNLYFPDWDGHLYALAEQTGAVVWKKNLTQLTGSAIAVKSRNTPAVAGELLLLGLLNPATILAVRRLDGSLVWSTQLDKHPNAIITMSGTVYNGSFYVGVSSDEEFANPSICCTFQGSFQKLDTATGKILWRTIMLPDNFGIRGRYAGAAVWGSSPAIDVGRNLVYIATGNNYQVPPDVEQCENNQGNLTMPVVPDPCLAPDDHSESVVALDLDSGIVKWSTHLGGYDAFTATCLQQPANPNCPTKLGPDYDFAECPMLITVASTSGSRDIAVAAQKSGVVWALDRDTGSIVWSTDLVVLEEELCGEQLQMVKSFIQTKPTVSR
ncbi:hypothetical protein O6H91_18G078600 [Diphasiastrum complanatum]|uniref:Uncharacterized protein n=1 Tax=Diphasiastrum complanatum TaxID=34168 RepID=A0ACC2B3W3_DIPCM|nr:hypothetical protein O6H91_18G078600 [Diphasiastrum complanatum]